MKNEIIIGDCADVLKSRDSESIDCIVTDPPYGYSFMGLSWDKALPSLAALKECNRVLKSGAFGFFMCAPRQDVLSRMIVRLEDAGFNVGFSSIFWAQSQGFPKSCSISKSIDKRNGRKPEEYKALGDYLRTQRELTGLSQKDIAEYFPSKTGGLTGCYWNWENAANVPTLEQWEILKELLDLDSRFDELIEREEAEREVIASSKCGKTAIMGGIQGKQTNEGSYDITAPATDKAREFSGAYTASLKPAVEVIITVMKHLKYKSYTDQVLDNGHGCLWLDECRIPYESDAEWKQHIRKDHGQGNSTDQYQFTDHKKGIPDSEGRFPANLLVSDNILDRGIITKSGAQKTTYKSNGNSIFGNSDYHSDFPSSSGDFSRYFSLDAWFDKKIQELPPEQQKTFPFLITPKPSKSEKNKYIENKHPTVKPLKLMSYLITMGSREGDLILDPFAGSGTTLEACKLLNRRFIGIDKDGSNKPLMEARGQLGETTLSAY